MPTALVDGRKLPRRLQVSGGGSWFLAGRGSFERVGAGDLSLEDLTSVEAELGKRVLVALPILPLLQDHLTRAVRESQGDRTSTSLWGASRRVQRYEQLRDRKPPTVSAVARGAQVAVLPVLGAVWVDRRRLFRPGELAILPWTEPRVKLAVVRPSTVQAAMREIIGRNGPRRAAEANGG